MTGYKHKNTQIGRYDWLTKDILQDSIDRLNKLKIENPVYEHPITVKIDKTIINGSIDILSEKHIWEIKCVNKLTVENILQLLIYSYALDKYLEQEHREDYIPEVNKKFGNYKIIEVYGKNNEMLRMLNTNTNEITSFKRRDFNRRLKTVNSIPKTPQRKWLPFPR